MTTCPVCGSECRVVSSDEGTSHYEPVAEVEIARLRKIEEAARALLDREYGWNGDMPYWNFTGPAYHEVRALRAALEEKR